jgi:peptide/nickel transport system permease protein
MLSEGRRYIQTAPWMIIYPGVAIFVCVLIFNILGDSVRDIMDPRYKNRKKRKNKRKTR